MASQNKITEMIASIKTIYPYYAKDADVKVLVRTWAAILKNYTDEEVDVAFFKCLQICKMPPTPADVIEQIAVLRQLFQPSAERLWDELMRTMRRIDDLRQASIYSRSRREEYNQKIKMLYEGLSKPILEFVGGRTELYRLIDHPDDLGFEKKRFLIKMKELQEQSHFSDSIKISQHGGSKELL